MTESPIRVDIAGPDVSEATFIAAMLEHCKAANVQLGHIDIMGSADRTPYQTIRYEDGQVKARYERFSVSVHYRYRKEWITATYIKEALRQIYHTLVADIETTIANVDRLKGPEKR